MTAPEDDPDDPSDRARRPTARSRSPSGSIQPAPASTGGDVSEPGPAQAHRPPSSSSRTCRVLLRLVPGRQGHLDLESPPQRITALIGPSGCGKSTLLRTINRMNDLIPGTRVEGQILYHGEDLYAKDVDPVEVRRRIGMVFQKPNPFPKSIYDNVAFGPRINGYKGDMDELVESQPAARGDLGRGQGQAQAVRAWPCPAASSSACASPGPSRRRPGRHPHGRAVLGPRPALARSRSRS